MTNLEAIVTGMRCRTELLSAVLCEMGVVGTLSVADSAVVTSNCCKALPGQTTA